MRVSNTFLVGTWNLLSPVQDLLIEIELISMDILLKKLFHGFTTKETNFHLFLINFLWFSLALNNHLEYSILL